MEDNKVTEAVSTGEVSIWDKLNAYMEEGTVLTVKVGGITNAGVICYVEKIRGFLPASHLSLKYVEDLNEWLDKEVRVKVITVDKSKKKLVLSAREVLKEEAEQERARKIAAVLPGSVVEGTVESLKPYGVFVDLGDGLSGLVHISQISRKRVNEPSDVLAVGDKVTAKVLNNENGKISLSMKVLEPVEEKKVVVEEKKKEAEDDYHYESDGEATTSLGSLFANIKLD